ncbi:MAG TPA: hypothetical protein VK858_19705 [Longimicrobiales bacterium]|nr:hypothetical protein [Longimicrobiales bacterium]
MQREWTDPRDGQAWLVTLNPFGAPGAPAPTNGTWRATAVFHRPGRQPSWTEYVVGTPLRNLGDQALMDLLDAAEDAMSRTRVERLRGTDGRARPLPSR